MEVREQIFSKILDVKPLTSPNFFLMFLGCTNIHYLDLTSFLASKQFSIHQILTACPSIVELTLDATPLQFEAPE